MGVPLLLVYLIYHQIVFKLNEQITSCYGCRSEFTRAADDGLPIPAINLILKCNEGRQYYDKAGTLQVKENLLPSKCKLYQNEAC